MTASVSGRNFRVFCATFFRSSGLLLLIAFQSFYIRRHVSVPALVVLPSPCVDIFSTAKQASKQRDFLSGPFLSIHRWRRFDGFDRCRILRGQVRNRNTVNCQKPSQASILLRRRMFSCSGGSNGSESEPFHSYRTRPPSLDRVAKPTTSSMLPQTEIVGFGPKDLPLSRRPPTASSALETYRSHLRSICENARKVNASERECTRRVMRTKSGKEVNAAEEA